MTPFIQTIETEKEPIRVQADPAAGKIRIQIYRAEALVHERLIPPPGNNAPTEEDAAFWGEWFAQETRSLFSMAPRVLQSPKNGEDAARLGVLFLAKGFLEEAHRAFSLTLQQDPRNFLAKKHLGILYTLQGKTEEAVATLHELYQANSTYADIAYALGAAYQSGRFFSESIECFHAALQQNPSFAQAWLALALSWAGVLVDQSASLTQEAISAYAQEIQHAVEQATVISPEWNTKSTLLALDALKRRQWPKCYQALSESLPKFRPKAGIEVLFLLSLMLIYGPQGITPTFSEKYVRCLEAWVISYPNYPDLRYQLALAEILQAQFAIRKSLKEIEAALGVKPDYPKPGAIKAVVEELYKKTLLALKRGCLEEGGSGKAPFPVVE